MSKIDEMFEDFYMRMEGDNSGRFAMVAQELWDNISGLFPKLSEEIKEQIVDYIMTSFRNVSY